MQNIFLHNQCGQLAWDILRLISFSSKFRTELFHSSFFDRWSEFVMDIYDLRKLEALCSSVLYMALSPDPA